MKSFRKLTLTLSVAGVVLAAGALFNVRAAADPQLLDLVDPEAHVITGLQVEDAKASAFGQKLLLKMEQHNEGFARIAEATGFDFRTDLTEIVASGAGPENGLILARGTFQPSRLANVALLAEATTRDYRGIQIISAPQHENETGESQPAPEVSVAFLSGSVAAAGTTSQVEAAIDRWISSSTNSSPLAAKALTASENAQAWGVSDGLAEIREAVGAPMETPDGAPPQVAGILNLLNAVEGTSGGITFGTDIQISGIAEASSPENAQAMADILTFLKVFARPEQAPEFATDLLDQASFVVDGSSVVFSLTVPEQVAEQFLEGPEVAARNQQPRRAERGSGRVAR